ncbi:MAG TPA: cytidine deaminase [Bacteroidia bacterium]|nr:cytidine deaminase [Bacteroidia bacterium]
MKVITITSTIEEYASESELLPDDLALLVQSRAAGKQAYAPYSAFHVGAALRLANGIIVSGNNQENVAYPSGLCAERVAIFHAGAVYPDVAVTAIAVTCSSERFAVNRPLSPCGACRQVMAEYEKRHNTNIRIILAGESGAVYIVGSIRELLPLSFEADELKAL